MLIFALYSKLLKYLYNMFSNEKILTSICQGSKTHPSTQSRISEEFLSFFTGIWHRRRLYKLVSIGFMSSHIRRQWYRIWEGTVLVGYHLECLSRGMDFKTFYTILGWAQQFF